MKSRVFIFLEEIGDIITIEEFETTRSLIDNIGYNELKHHQFFDKLDYITNRACVDKKKDIRCKIHSQPA